MYIISKEELQLLKNIKDQELTAEEGEFILENKKIFVKYFLKIMTNIQLSLGLGHYEGQEIKAYARIEAIRQLISGLDDIEKGFQEFNLKKS
jgi:hypothetical protein